MILVKHNGQISSISFRYETDRRTVATVYQMRPDDDSNGYRQDKIISVAEANCHPDDNFCKAEGRKKSLTRAIKKFDKSFRAAIWKEYLRCCKI